MTPLFVKLTDIVRDGAFTLRNFGWRETVKALSREIRLLFFSSAEFIVLVCPLDEPIEIPDARIPVQVRRGALEDLDQLGTFVPPSHVSHYRRLFERGDSSVCFVAEHNGRIVACCWASEKVVHRVPFRLAPSEVYTHDAYTDPDYRGLGIQSRLIAFRSRWMFDHGYRRILSLVEVDNVASQGMLSKAGYRPLRRLTRSRFLWWYRFSGAAE